MFGNLIWKKLITLEQLCRLTELVGNRQFLFLILGTSFVLSRIISYKAVHSESFTGETRFVPIPFFGQSSSPLDFSRYNSFCSETFLINKYNTTEEMLNIKKCLSWANCFVSRKYSEQIRFYLDKVLEQNTILPRKVLTIHHFLPQKVWVQCTFHWERSQGKTALSQDNTWQKKLYLELSRQFS